MNPFKQQNLSIQRHLLNRLWKDMKNAKISVDRSATEQFSTFISAKKARRHETTRFPPKKGTILRKDVSKIEKHEDRVPSKAATREELKT